MAKNPALNPAFHILITHPRLRLVGPFIDKDAVQLWGQAWSADHDFNPCWYVLDHLPMGATAVTMDVVDPEAEDDGDYDQDVSISL